LVLSIEEARALYGDADSVHDFDHILRVLALAERIAKVEGANPHIVRTAVLLHDWGRAEAQSAGRNHADVAGEQAERFLASRGVPPAQIAAVVHAIVAHRFRADPMPQTLEAKALFDADKLDAIGAIGVARAFAYGGGHNQRMWAPRDAVDVEHWERHGDDPSEHTAVHEFLVKLARIRERLYTAEGRRIAENRHHYMAAFFDRLDAEVRGEF
jgi:uncharacterized protein